jgi:predicted small metal-binding protein
MKTSCRISLFAAALAVAVFASLGIARENSLKVSSPHPLMTVSCPPECGFMCRSHDEKELIEIVKTHAKNAHGKILTDEQVRSFMHTEE